MSFKNILPLFLLIFLVACQEEKPPAKESIRPVRAAKVIKTGIATTNTFSGITQSSKSTPLSFKVSGVLNKIYVQVGDEIRRGQNIARIDATDYSVSYDQAIANLRSAETQIASAETQLYTAKAAYQRIEKLYENNSVPLSDYEQARGQYEAAQAQATAAKAQTQAARKQVEAARNQVGYANLTAPFTGIITEVKVEENQLVNSGTPIVTLSSLGEPEVKVGVPELYIAQIKKGDEVNISFSILPDKVFKGKVQEVGYSALGGTYPITVEIIKPGTAVRPGMAASVIFNFSGKPQQEQEVVVPAKAVGEDPKGNFVFELVKEGEHYIAKRKSVEVGDLTPNGFVVKSGIETGTTVATAGLRSLLDGMKVKLAEE